MYTPIPLQDAPMSEVLARVSFRLIQRHYWRMRPDVVNRDELLYTLANRLQDTGFRALSLWITGCAHYCNQSGVNIYDWREDVVVRSRRAAHNRRVGKPWARVR